ncbi:MAG: glutamine amidotransferase-related protein [bacterium]
MPQPKRRVVLIDHHDNPPGDRASTHLAARGYRIDWRYPVHGERLGAPGDDVAGSVVFGGLQNVDEIARYPFLHDEVAWIRACHARGVPLLGICLGAQLIAHAFGAAVAPMPGGRCEFGYYPIAPTAHGRDWLPPTLHVTQAHFRQFDLPPGATLLATGQRESDGKSDSENEGKVGDENEGKNDDASAPCINQAFRCGARTYALQFHPEVTAPIFRRWQDSEWAFFDAPGAQHRARQTELMARHDAAQHEWFVAFLDRLFGAA